MLGLAVKLALGGRLRTVVYVEREAYAAAALVARMADAALDDAPVWDDVTTCASPEFMRVVGGFRPLVVTAGYPCQPFSVAGKRRGVRDDRHLWPWIDAFIGAAEPECVFLENVPGHLRMGFGSVWRDLQRRGYRVAAGLFSAEEVGASHRRERLLRLTRQQN
jgi:DNA (cytosine-5)-methyltransferase 1